VPASWPPEASTHSWLVLRGRRAFAGSGFRAWPTGSALPGGEGARVEDDGPAGGRPRATPLRVASGEARGHDGCARPTGAAPDRQAVTAAWQRPSCNGGRPRSLARTSRCCFAGAVHKARVRVAWAAATSSARARPCARCCWRLAADSPTANGMPHRSTSKWYLDPGVPRSVGFGPVRQPPAWRARSSCPGTPATSRAGRYGRAGPATGGRAAATSRRAANRAAAASRSPDCRSRASRCVAAARGPSAQLVDDAGESGTVIDARATAAAGWWSGEQRLDGPPQLLGDESVHGDGHGRAPCP
jgi:hypothetical protein